MMVRSSKRKKPNSSTLGSISAFDYEDVVSLCDVSRACILGSHEELSRLISEGKSVRSCDNRGFTPLHLAAESGHLECCRILLTSDDTEINKPSFCEITPLMKAAEGNCIDLVKLLISSGADTNAVDSDGNSCFDRALDNDNIELFKYLLSKTDPNISSFEGWSIAHTCARDHQKLYLKLIIEDPRYLWEPTCYGITPLHLAAQHGNLDCAKLLVESKVIVKDEHSNSEIFILNKPAEDGVTPIFLAAQNKHFDTLSYLLDSGADVSVVSDLGTVLHSAVVGNAHTCIRLLLERGADVEGGIGKTSVDTPLSQAVFNGDKEVVSILLEFNADPLCRSSDEYSSSPLHLAFQTITKGPFNETDLTEHHDILSLIVEKISPAKVDSAISKEIVASTLDDSGKVELFQMLPGLISWSISRLWSHEVVIDIVHDSFIKCLAYLIRCNYHFLSTDFVNESLWAYFRPSEACSYRKKLACLALFDQTTRLSIEFYSLLVGRHFLNDDVDYNVLSIVGRLANEPRTLVDLCKLKIRILLPCSTDFTDIVKSLDINNACKEIISFQRNCHVTLDILEKFSDNDSLSEEEIINYLVM